MNWMLHKNIHRTWTLYSLFFILLSVGTIAESYEKCLTDYPEIHAKRYPYYKNSPVTIKIDTSDRISHKLNSHAFMIFAQEVLGYPRMELSYFEDHFNIFDTVDRLGDQVQTNIPKATINLEVWVSPDKDTIDMESLQRVEDCGNVANTGGRFGWFIPNDLTKPIDKFYKKWYPEITEVSWSMFRNPELSSYFDVDESDMDMIRENSFKNHKTKEYFCKNCTSEGMYIPQRCRKNQDCALLLAPDYLSTNFVVEHIDELKLFVKVVWLGDNLPKVVKSLRQKYKAGGLNKSVVFITWTPSIMVMDEREFITVGFKKCELLNSSSHLGCKYEINRLVKFAWIGLQEIAKPLLEATRLFSFRENAYESLLNEYRRNPEGGVRNAACEWMKKSRFIWQDWNPVLDSKIYIGGIFPMHNSPYVGQGIALAAKMAESAINENKSILGDYKLEVLMSDGQCRSDLVMKMFIDYVVNKQFESLIGVLGPACSDTVEPLASVSKHYQTMIISYSAEGSSFSDRETYPYFFRTIGENKHYNQVYVKFFKHMGWKQIAALTEDGQKYTEYISQMQSLLDDYQITLISNKKFPRNPGDINMSKYLEELKKQRARIIIADVVDEVARLIMCEAFKLQMTPKKGYVWFLPISYNNLQGGEINCTAQEMLEVTNGYFSLAHAYYGDDNAVMQENITVKEWRDRYKARSNTQKMSDYAGYAYDAVWTYALATDKLAKTDPEALSHIHSNTTIKKLVEIINDTDFMGVSGRIKFRGGPSRFSVINIMQWYDNKTHIVGQFHPNLTDHTPVIHGGRLEINSSLIRWFTANGKKPDDGKLPPETCALESLARFFDVDCSMAIVILNIIVISTVLLIIGFIIYHLKKRYDRKVQEATNDYIKNLGWWHNIESLKDLGMLEVSRKDVIINRKIGEGSFGTVFGGEACFEEGWLPVAVKTLRMGANTDEKIDFLSEADIMRNFDHTNIIRLLGVIMEGEPLYVIMEFMLYGDVKTYLLARRHLVFQKGGTENNEISSERLTSMALDIARGLSYLAECKFVHRDLASRNCLVNGNKMVKIGDFGMCRPMADKEYYRFDRKGMLPVRWMAPESLALGVFTTASDVWSYGVLLYEIVTFGSFPFQGLSNSEVLEAVKQGKTLTVPKGVKPQLEGLMKSCWNRTAKARPQAKEIVAYIACYKDLLTPCLDAPLSSVQIENSDELEMRFPNRKGSTTPTTKNFPSFSRRISATKVTEARKFKKQASIPENSVSIPLESYCPKEPLLNEQQEVPTTNHYHLVPSQHASNDSGVQEDDDYMPASMLMNGHANTKI
ncbi:uncharacterized protein LOC123679301 isoform X2 [Harmonia axyridis]|nr:uncharacterized protein LOC123679301 isoform X2 [Harmonia axyridis]XP_045472775.1 uncharacterized protein LOC123679301 isoform X2 [Harmonia axyridis]